MPPDSLITDYKDSDKALPRYATLLIEATCDIY